MTYIKKQGNKWQFTISYSADGKTKLIKKSGFLSKEDAQAEAAKHEA
ncbi:Arm DNA-binding domain-containing protein [Caldifermentibacillus hisashii]|uniref:Arm DNA-binding domain-containing protein n=1 Tax=Caldifermentibacillus hisashii TaxID=996558 RepID=A0ABU9JZF9_9BACI